MAKRPRHGYATRKIKHPLHGRWFGMIQRCHFPGHHNFKNYGGRGITVCERWHYFPNFLADMGEAPAGLTLDRINNDGNYEPSNCRWATAKQQQSNCRLPCAAVVNGERLRWPEVRQRFGVHPGLLRLWKRLGYDVEQMILNYKPKSKAV